MPPFTSRAADAPRNDDDDPNVDQIVEKVTKGECVLFLGSAVHSPPPLIPDIIYPKDKRPAIGSELSLKLAAQSRFSNTFCGEDARNLQRVALHYEMILHRNVLVDKVRELVHDDKEPSPMLELLARLKFPLVITTNYDQLFEKAIQNAKKGFTRCVYTPERNKRNLVRDYCLGEDAHSAAGHTRPRQGTDPQNPFILKIHGDIVEDPGSLVITDEDYVTFVLRMGQKGNFNPVPKVVLEKLSTWPTLFIGYSLKDYNLRLLFKTLRWSLDSATIRPMYSIDLRPDPLIREYWDDHKRYVSFIVTDLWKFIPRLYAKVPDTAKLPIHL
jgi:hypothetical protein